MPHNPATSRPQGTKGGLFLILGLTHRCIRGEKNKQSAAVSVFLSLLSPPTPPHLHPKDRPRVPAQSTLRFGQSGASRQLVKRLNLRSRTRPATCHRLVMTRFESGPGFWKSVAFFQSGPSCRDRVDRKKDLSVFFSRRCFQMFLFFHGRRRTYRQTLPPVFGSPAFV